MLFLLFRAGENTFAVDARQIREIIPRVALRECPQAPDFIAGLFNYRGAVVPVVDFNRLLCRAACRPRLSTRILLAVFTHPKSGAQRTLGILVESLTETMEKNESEFVKSGLANPQTPYLGGICCEPERIIQRLHLPHLLSENTESMLFNSA